jgi:hypothetical protein
MFKLEVQDIPVGIQDQLDHVPEGGVPGDIAGRIVGCHGIPPGVEQ